jgi:hypothetical protein
MNHEERHKDQWYGMMFNAGFGSMEIRRPTHMHIQQTNFASRLTVGITPLDDRY